MKRHSFPDRNSAKGVLRRRQHWLHHTVLHPTWHLADHITVEKHHIYGNIAHNARFWTENNDSVGWSHPQQTGLWRVTEYKRSVPIFCTLLFFLETVTISTINKLSTNVSVHVLQTRIQISLEGSLLSNIN